MTIRRFISEEKVNIAVQAIVFLCVNGYFILLNIADKEKGDLLYLDILLITIYLGGLWLRYTKWKARYENLYAYVEEEKEITREEFEKEAVQNGYIAEKIIDYILEQKEKEFSQKQTDCEIQLREMEEYISKWVHEIKLPLSALNMIIERIDDEVGYTVQNEVEKISFLVNSVLYGSRMTASAEDLFIVEESLETIVKSAVKNQAFFLIKNHIEVEIKDLNFEVYTDKKWLGYVIEQIINNAVKYTKADGKVSFYGEDKGKYIVLNIKDNGIGIAKEDIQRIFNKGFTGRNGRNTTYKSTGMGLYFSKKILDKLNHPIEVESIEGEYTIFKISFGKISDYIKVAKM